MALPRVRAPEIDRPGLLWSNVGRPPGLRGLRGRVVLLHFWTASCVNCVHVLPTLRRVEEHCRDAVAVVGVHSPKYPAERAPGHATSAVARLGLRHPVVHDPDLVLWRQYAVRAWPTIVVVDPRGYVVEHIEGEPDPDRLIETLERLLAGAPDPTPLEPIRPAAPAPTGRLAFPGKITAVPGPTPRFALADAGHHQVVLLDDGGRELRRFGSGAAGLVDGPAERAAFRDPQGVIADARTLYVADTGNHALRALDLSTGVVATLAGTGERGPVLRGAGPAARTPLASPLDAAIVGRGLIFANAGTHQLGLLDLRAGEVGPFAGTGRENIHDGPANEALFAQPSGLAHVADDGPDGALYVADAETSAVRRVSLGPTPAVTTLVGRGLFVFGRGDGPFDDALLQHPLALAWFAGDLLVADAYNDAIRRLDLGRRVVEDLDGGRFVCLDPLCLPLSRPSGVAAAGPGRVLVSASGNHRVVAYGTGDGTCRTWFA